MRVPFVANFKVVVINELNWLLVRLKVRKRIKRSVDRKAEEFYVSLGYKGNSIKAWKTVYSELCELPCLSWESIILNF